MSDVRTSPVQGDTLPKNKAKSKKRTLGVDIRFSQGEDPFDKIKWKKQDVQTMNMAGDVVFEQKDVEFPESWSDNSVRIVASKYFAGKLGTPEREHSLKQLIGRVDTQITEWAVEDGYLAKGESFSFKYELRHILVNQMGAFNSPVWFNLGVRENPQISACFLNHVDDTMQSIRELADEENKVFKGGSGAGVNMSNLRGSMEGLSGGGFSSGPMPFILANDWASAATKSGGKTRRAAKMVQLDADHPDIEEFINCKYDAEKMAHDLIDNSGYSGNFDDPKGAYARVPFQNANHSVRVTDEFMQKATNPENEWTWDLTARTTGDVVKMAHADEMLDNITEAAWYCADPGLMFHDTINRMNTVANDGEIKTCNPCAEVHFLDDVACNLFSWNLLKFLKDDGSFDIDGFCHAVDVVLLAMEVLVRRAGYPTEKFAKGSDLYGILGMGYANMGALLMAKGLPYDSDEGRNYAALITSLMAGRSYARSGEIAERVGPFPRWEANKEPMRQVMKQHEQSHLMLESFPGEDELWNVARREWERVEGYALKTGFRNAQTVVIAPTGTIAFMMGCDTTGIEPATGLVTYKQCVGGGHLKIVNGIIPRALKSLDYNAQEVEQICKWIEEGQPLTEIFQNGSSHKRKVFHCAFPSEQNPETLSWKAHIDMCAAVTPFLSGAVSKTINMPADSTVEDVKQAYVYAWKQGMKCISIYRDGCKRSQPLTNKKTKEEVRSDAIAAGQPVPTHDPLDVAYNEALAGIKDVQGGRRKLPETRQALNHRFSIGGHDGYVNVGLFDDGTPGELFIKMSKEGSTVAGLMDTIGILTSLGLQHGVPLDVMVNKLSRMKFEPAGITQSPDKDLKFADSPVDYIFRWMEKQFPGPMAVSVDGNVKAVEPKTVVSTKTCKSCGNLLQQTGSCYTCPSCGTNEGGCG